MNYIETKIRRGKQMEDGCIKKVTEHYLVDAVSFTEAEARVTKELAPYYTGDYIVTAVKKSNIAEVFQNIEHDAVSWYKVKADFITIDERTGKEKRTSVNYLVQGGTCEAAIAHFRHSINMMADYDIMAVQLTPILEVFDYRPDAASNATTNTEEA